MGFFSELDMDLRSKNVARPFDTPKYSDLILNSYKEGRENRKKKKPEFSKGNWVIISDWFDDHVEIIGVDDKTKKLIIKKIKKELKDEIHNSSKG